MFFGENRDDYDSYFEVDTECAEYKKYYILEKFPTERVLYLILKPIYDVITSKIILNAIGTYKLKNPR